MNLKDKLARVEQELLAIATHDDASVTDVKSTLEAVKANVEAKLKAVVERRLGSFRARLVRYFARLYNALRGKE